MSRYEQLFQHLQSRNQGAFIPFVTLGDPSAEVSCKLLMLWWPVVLMPWKSVFRFLTRWQTAR